MPKREGGKVNNETNKQKVKPTNVRNVGKKDEVMEREGEGV
jgi:hypothetical protein